LEPRILSFSVLFNSFSEGGIYNGLV